MARIRLDAAEIVDRGSFHDGCHRGFGFPEFYGRNMDAWIDCMPDLQDAENGITELKLGPGESLAVEVAGFDDFRARLPEIARELIECTQFANERYRIGGEATRIHLHPA
jgi:hypothetical protein